MVNTFLVCTDFYISAKCIDNLRLNKQILEAMYIYRVIRNLKLLGTYYNMPPPLDNYMIYNWIREIIKKYKQENVQFLFKNSEGIPIIIKKDIKMVQQSYGQDVFIENGKYKLVDNQNPKKKPQFVDIDKLVFLNDALIKLGYVYHPVILMWFHYVPALILYIKIHVDEFISRGGNNRVNITLLSDIIYPPWCNDSNFLIRHRSNLIRKLNNWYKPMFPEIPDNLLYFWPYTPKVGNGISDSNKIYR